MNKHGAMEIVLFVVLTALVVSVALFTFGVNPPYTKVNVYDARFVESVFQEQDLAEFYIKQVGEEVIEKNGKENFPENFQTEFGKYDFVESYLNDLKKVVSEGNFNIVTEENVLIMTTNSWEIKDSFESIQVMYTPKISVKFDLEK